MAPALGRSALSAACRANSICNRQILALVMPCIRILKVMILLPFLHSLSTPRRVLAPHITNIMLKRLLERHRRLCVAVGVARRAVLARLMVDGLSSMAGIRYAVVYAMTGTDRTKMMSTGLVARKPGIEDSCRFRMLMSMPRSVLRSPRGRRELQAILSGVTLAARPLAHHVSSSLAKRFSTVHYFNI